MLVLLLLCLGVTHAQNLQVNTSEGFVEGSTVVEGNYHAFYGIPYAGATDGNNRFKPPTKPSPYPGLFHAMDRNIICAQPSERGFIGVENCLTLDIYTNNVTTPKPVLVWLNAEEYTSSSSTTQPLSFRRFVEEGIVVVSMNFRLSIFGFLCLRVPQAPGNAGLKDVIHGLKWIRRNIAGFGGNPDNVVLMGHGSAGAMVDLITLSPVSANLVHKAVAISGSGLAPWAVAYDPIGYAHMVADKLSYSKKSNAELAELLATTGGDVLTRALSGFNFYNNTPLFAPCLEDPNSNYTVLTDAPIDILKSGNYSQIPYIAAYVTREGTLRAEEAVFDGWLEKMQANFSSFLQPDLSFGNNLTSAAQTINEFYFSGTPISMVTIEDYLDYQGDTLVQVSVIRGVRERAATSRSEVRLLEFAFMGTLNSDWTLSQVPLLGVKHGGLLNYMFDFDLRPTEEHVMRSVVKRFSSFAYTGNPNPPASEVWSAITPQNLFYLYYGGSASVTPQDNGVYTETIKFNPHNIRMILWNQLYSQYYKALPPGSYGVSLMSMFWMVVLSVAFVKIL